MKRKTVTGLSGTEKQPRISSFFSQQSSPQKHSTNSTIDLTLEDPEVDEQPPIKKLKVTKGNSLADQWRFDSTRKPVVERPTAGVEDDKKRRHEKFKRVLLADNSSFAHQEYHQAQGAQSSEDEPLQDQDDAPESDVQDDAFENLAEIFSYKANKGKRKTRLTSSAKGKGTSEGLGPSGQPYTPAELQASLVDHMHLAFNNVFVQS